MHDVPPRLIDTDSEGLDGRQRAARRLPRPGRTRGRDAHAYAVTKSISPLDSDPYARALAASTPDKNRAPGETRIAARGLPRVNTAGPATMNRIYAILDKRPRCLHPLSETFTRRDLAAAKLAASQMCDPRISGDCEKRCATEVFAIKRGELVCVYKACRPCVEFFDAPGRLP